MAAHPRDDPRRHRRASPCSTKLRELFAKPLAASIFLVDERPASSSGASSSDDARSRAADGSGRRGAPTSQWATTGPAGSGGLDDALVPEGRRPSACTQVLALLAGISRSGVTMVAGLVQGLDHEDAARFSFMLATPVILLAGLARRSRTSPGRSATACGPRRSSPRCAPGSPRGRRRGSSCGGSGRGRCGRSGSTASSRAPPAPSTSPEPPAQAPRRAGVVSASRLDGAASGERATERRVVGELEVAAHRAVRSPAA